MNKMRAEGEKKREME